jgi:serine O-acetyltransferase
MSVIKDIIGDINATIDLDPAATGKIEVILFYPGFHARLVHRLAHFLHKKQIKLLARGLMYWVRLITNIEIHPGANIGPRFVIDHGAGIVIGETTEIGPDVTLYQGVTLGGTSTKKIKRHPTLAGDNIVGAGAKIIGAVEIGHGARIGAGSVVLTNVPDNATIIGVPGHITHVKDDSNGVIQRMPDPEWERLNLLDTKMDELNVSIAHLQKHIEELHTEQHK